MAGRPPASYAYPRLWLHLSDLGYLPNSRALKNIRDKHGKNFRFGTTFSNSLLEEKFRPQLPRLVDQDTACDLVELVSRARKADGQLVLVVSKEVVQFDHQIEGL